MKRRISDQKEHLSTKIGCDHSVMTMDVLCMWAQSQHVCAWHGTMGQNYSRRGSRISACTTCTLDSQEATSACKHEAIISGVRRGICMWLTISLGYVGSETPPVVVASLEAIITSHYIVERSKNERRNGLISDGQRMLWIGNGRHGCCAWVCCACRQAYKMCAWHGA